MAVSISLPMAVYHGFLGRCKLGSRRYEILRNSMLEHREGQSIVEILCSQEDADILLDHAISYYPPAVNYLRKSAGATGHVQSDELMCLQETTDPLPAPERMPHKK